MDCEDGEHVLVGITTKVRECDCSRRAEVELSLGFCKVNAIVASTEVICFATDPGLLSWSDSELDWLFYR